MKSLAQVVLVMLRLYWRDRVSLVLSLVLTAFMMLLFGAVGGENQLRLSVAVCSESPDNAPLLEALRHDLWIDVRPAASADEVGREVRSGRSVLGLVLHSGGGLERAEVVLGDNPSRWAVLGMEHLENALRRRAEPSLALAVRHVGISKSRNIDFIFPGILAMAIMQASLGGGHLLLDARRRGILRRLRLVPFEPAKLFVGYFAGRLVVVFINVGFLALLAKLVFQASVVGSWADLLGAILLGSSVFLTLGVVIAFLAPSAEGGNLLTQILGLVMSFLCGIFFSPEQIPAFFRWIPALLPLTHLVNAFRGIANVGLPLLAFKTEVAVLLAWFLATSLLAAFVFRFSLQRSE
jgi:ABC-2 type transport system permease protein